MLDEGFGFLLWWRQRYNKKIFFDVNEQNCEEVYLGNLKKFHFKELQDGNAIGVEIQFQTEVEMISLVVHRNLLRQYGFCMTAAERLLVYPYKSNGSVASL
ncbi:hypothetical protein RIF29_20989 [Crotalaria pallida]|uniref:Uncharacterized protein n=1 Tax=Crotalaria pallida TaxID=3830 RepID=A0AAN9F225_CROPI